MSSSSQFADLPREQLIGWIARQLDNGVRHRSVENAVDPPVDSQTTSVRDQISQLFDCKKNIIKLAKEVSFLVHAVISEKWRAVELRSQVVQQTTESEELLNQECQKLISEIPSIWGQILEMYNEDVAARDHEDKLLQEEGKSSVVAHLDVSAKKQAALDTYLHERYLLKKRIEDGSVLEKNLRERIVGLSAQLHSMKDVGRIEEAVNEQQRTHVEEKFEMQERELEWKLMEEEVMLTKAIDEASAKGEARIQRLSKMISSVNETYLLEKDYLYQQEVQVREFKSSIARIRTDVRAVENTVSKFKSYLRHEEKVKRDLTVTQPLRE